MNCILGIPHRACVGQNALIIAAVLAVSLAGCKGGTAAPYEESARIKLRYVGGALAFSPTDQLLAVGTEGKSDRESEFWQGYLQIWDLSKNAELQFFSFDRRVSAVCFSPDGKRLAVGSASDDTGKVGRLDKRKPGELAVFDMSKCTEDKRIRLETDGVWGLAFSRDGKHLVVLHGTWHRDEALKLSLYDAATLKRLFTYEQSRCAWAFSVSPDGKVLAVGHTEAKHQNPTQAQVRFFDLTSGKRERAFAVEGDQVNCLQYAVDGKSLLVSGARFWDVESGKPASAGYAMNGCFDGILSGNGKWLACRRVISGGSFPGTNLGVWDFSSEALTKWHISDARYTACAFSPDNKLLAVSGRAVPGNESVGEVVIWNLTKKK